MDAAARRPQRGGVLDFDVAGLRALEMDSSTLVFFMEEDIALESPDIALFGAIDVVHVVVGIAELSKDIRRFWGIWRAGVLKMRFDKGRHLLIR